MSGRGGHGRVAGLAAAVAVLALGARAGAVTLESPLGRWSAGGYAEGYAVFPVDPDSQRQRPEGILDLTLTGEPHRRARLFLDARTTFGGPIEHGRGPGIVNLSDTFQNDSPYAEIEEGYLDLFLPSVDVRLGKQKFAWGKLDTFQPTDVLNPRRFTDPFVTEEQDTKIGVPALRASYFVPPLAPRLAQDVSLTLVWVPVPVPVRFPLPGERWFPAAASVPRVFRLPGRTFGPGLPDLVVTTRLAAENVRPPQQLDEGSVGLRLTGLSGRADWSLYYYDGNETAPSFAFATSVFAPRPSRFGECVNGLRPGPCRMDSDALLRPRFGRIRLAGGDVALELGGFTARLEGAYGTDRLLPRTVTDLVGAANVARVIRPRLGSVVARLVGGKRVSIDLGDLFVARDTVEWGAGIDYRYRGWMPVLQVNQTLVLDNPTSLLVNDVDSRLFLVVRKSFLAERLATEAGVVQELERGYTSGITRFTYTLTDHFRVRLGYLLIAGTRRSLIGQFHQNDEGFLQVRYSF